MPSDDPHDESAAHDESASPSSGHGRDGMLGRLGRRRTLTVMIVLGLVAAAGFGVRHVRADPIRYGVAVPPIVDGVDYGEAHLMKQLRDSVERTAGPYIGPNPNLSDTVGALNVDGVGPTGHQTFSQVLSSRVDPGHDFTGQAQALVRLCFYSAGWLLPTESGPLLERCRLVTVRYDGGAIRVRSRRAPCPQQTPPRGAGCTQRPP